MSVLPSAKEEEMRSNNDIALAQRISSIMPAPHDVEKNQDKRAGVVA